MLSFCLGLTDWEQVCYREHLWGGDDAHRLAGSGEFTISSVLVPLWYGTPFCGVQVEGDLSTKRNAFLMLMLTPHNEEKAMSYIFSMQVDSSLLRLICVCRFRIKLRTWAIYANW